MPSGIYIRTKENIENLSKAAKERMANPKARNNLSKKFKGKHHSPKTEFKKGEHLREKHPHWKGGKVIQKEYIHIHSPNHPFKRSNNYYPEHRLVMEKHLDRYLSPKETVHHINHIRTDNRIENLKLFKNNSEHMKHHPPWNKGLKGVQLGPKKRNGMYIKCLNCDKELYKEPKSKRKFCSKSCGSIYMWFKRKQN